MGRFHQACVEKPARIPLTILRGLQKGKTQLEKPDKCTQPLTCDSLGWHPFLIMVLTDEFGNLLPMGTTVLLWPHSPHVGTVGYTPWDLQVVGHNSKQHGSVVITWPEGFNDGYIPFQYRLPPSVEHGKRVWQNVLTEAERGVLWTPLDNCQDFVSRVNTGQGHSPSRDAILGGLAIVGGLAWLASSKRTRRRRRSRRFS